MWNELLAVFDADFVPQPEFLKLSVPYFSDPKIGLVQGRGDVNGHGWTDRRRP